MLVKVHQLAAQVIATNKLKRPWKPPQLIFKHRLRVYVNLFSIQTSNRCFTFFINSPKTLERYSTPHRPSQDFLLHSGIPSDVIRHKQHWKRVLFLICYHSVRLKSATFDDVLSEWILMLCLCQVAKLFNDTRQCMIEEKLCAKLVGFILR